MRDMGLDRDEVVEQIEILAPPERVWNALTEPNQLSEWWEEDGVSHIESWQQDLTVGGALEARWTGPKGESYLLRGRFLSVEPPRLLAYTWEANWIAPATSVVRWELQPTAAGTMVTVTHSGLANYPDAVKDYSSGWPVVVQQLRAYVVSH